MSRRGAVFGLTAFLLVAAQCFALCSVMPCAPARVASTCHHQAPADENPCGHEGFVTEGAAKSDPVVAVLVGAPVGALAPEMRVSDAVAVAHSRVAPDLPSISILRI